MSDEDLYDFYNEVIPNTVTCVADLAKWWKGEFEAHPHLLDFDPSKVERLLDQESVSMEDFPDHWVAVGSDERVIELRLSYVYDTHDPADGVTVHDSARRSSSRHFGTAVQLECARAAS
mgnify:CR=1 FL=1